LQLVSITGRSAAFRPCKGFLGVKPCYWAKKCSMDEKSAIFPQDDRIAVRLSSNIKEFSKSGYKKLNS
jgi:hypothetical protein